MARSPRRAAFEAEHGTPSVVPPQQVMVTQGVDSALFAMVDSSAPRTPEPGDIEPHIIEPQIQLAETPIITKGGDLASTALKNIMNTFNAASRKSGVDTIWDAVVDDRFSTHFGGRQGSLPHAVAGFMDGKAIGATLRDDDTIQGKEPKHKKDIEALNGSDAKRVEGLGDDIIAHQEAEIKKWLAANYGAGAEQITDHAYDSDRHRHKVTHKDREALIKKVRELEDDAKKIASGEMLPYGSIASDEEPLSEEDRDIADQYEREGKEL